MTLEDVPLPSFGYWYTPGFWAVQRGIVLALMGRRADAIREAELGVAVMPAAHRGAGWLSSMLTQVHPDLRA